MMYGTLNSPPALGVSNASAAFDSLVANNGRDVISSIPFFPYLFVVNGVL
jgi:hypothetical protein